MLSEEKRDNSRRGNIQLVQITDSHLFESPEARLAGLNCQETFDEVISLIKQQQDGIDCFLCTGDIAQDSSVAGYKRFYDTVAEFGAPQLWIPGNHDIADNVAAAVGADNPCLKKAQHFGNWLMLMLDSSVKGQVHGFLDQEELDYLDQQLQASLAESFHVLICTHHNPMPVQAKWLQNHALKNEMDFFAVIDKYPHVKCVLWGHIHQEYDQMRKNVRMLATPSTCIQFHPDNDEFTLDDINPGYRWLSLSPEGGLETAVERVSSRHFEIDFSSSGY